MLAKIEQLLLANLHSVLPQSLLGKALHYLASQWSKLVRFVDDGTYPICNNAYASVNLYSLLQTCIANGIDPYRYLTALLTELPKAKTADDFEALLPWRITLIERRATPR